MREEWTSILGIEVENRRMLGKRTLFVHDLPIPEGVQVEHIYFTYEFLQKHGFNVATDYLGKCEITLEVTPGMLQDINYCLRACHIVVLFTSVGLDDLIKNSDTIKILLGDLHTKTITYGDMLEATPKEFKYDECAG